MTVLVDATDDPLVGQDIGGYRVVARIGQGGMGRVYRGVLPASGERVAIKVLARDLIHDAGMAERFIAEARLANVVRHPGLVNVISVGVLPDGRPYQIMELLEGESLAALIRRAAPLPLGTLATLIAEVLDAIAPMHERNLIHRDLKPSNLFVTTAGRVKVIDFGIAKLVTDDRGLTRTGETVGTPEYMAPEQIERNAADGRTDLYALGVVLYEGATSHRPFVAMPQLARLDPPRIRPLVPEAPAALDAVLARALAYDRDRRFATAAEMAAALRAAVAGMPPSAFAPIAPAAAPATTAAADSAKRTDVWGAPTVPMLQPEDLIGRNLGGFVVREQIGAGGFGLVYRAEQPILEREAVIKVLRASDPAPSFVERFMREARLASRLDHPFAAHVYAFGAEPDGLLWIAMEQVRGTPLDRIIADRPIALERLVPLVERLCEVIQTAHDQGIVHRDVKPSNVLVISRAGRLMPKLIDFGISTAGVAVADHVGSPPYMAPECWIEGSSLDHRVDLYAIGVLIYEALTGRYPLPGATAIEIGHAHVHRPVPPLGPDFAPALDAVVARAMAKQPADRFQTALELSAALRAASGMPVDQLPLLDESVRAHAIAEAARPVAEAVAALDSVSTAGQLEAALVHAVDVVARWLGALAVASRTRQPSSEPDSPRAAELLGTLASRPFPAETWLELARELVAPYRARPRHHPIPELVTAIEAAAGALATLLEETVADAAALARRVTALGGVLAAMRSLDDYELLVPRERGAEVWMGVRRPQPRIAMPRRALPEGEPILVDREGVPVLALWPLVSILRPSPAVDEEVFFLDGKTRFGTRLCAPVAPGRRLERHDDTEVAAWHHEQLGGPLGRPGSVVPVERAPYRGLVPFTRDDADLFFGREAEADAFANRLRVTPLVAVVGPSGAGKSSFVQAGVLPRLPEAWKTLVVRPGATPFATLAARLAVPVADLAREPRALGAALAAAGQTFVLVVDQFEELLTLCPDPSERLAYASALVAAAEQGDAVRIVLTIRDDFLIRVQALAPLRDRLAHGLALLATPGADELHRILVEPAHRVGYEFDDPALPDEMVRDVADRPGALALLSFTALRLWELRDKHFLRLTRSAYDTLGGVGGALAQHAEDTLAAIDAADAPAVREVFRHLVTAEGTRATIERRELVELTARGANVLPAAAERVLERLVHARLLLASEGERGGADLIEVIHEALLVSWPRLVGWHREDAENLRLRDQLRAAARQWDARGRPTGLLWRGDAALELRLWRARYPGALTTTEDAFARAAFAEQARGRRWRTLAVAVVIAGLATAAVVFARLRGVADDNRVRAVAGEAVARQRLLDSYVETGRRALVAGESTTALLYLDEAFRRGIDTPAMRFMLARALEPLDSEIATLAGHDGLVWDIAFSPDGTRVATAAEDGTARIWDRAGKVLATLGGQPRARMDVAWSPDGALVATATAGPVRLWDGATGAARAELVGHTGTVWCIAFAPDGRSLASASGPQGDHAVRVWDVPTGTGRVIERLAADTHACVAWSPDGGQLAIATSAPGPGNTVVVRSLVGDRRTVLAGHTGGVWYAQFDPGGTRVASASVDRTSRVWDATTGRTLHVLAGHDSRVTDVAWSPDGASIATASADATIRIWDARSGATRLRLAGHTAQVNRLRWSADGKLLVSASNDGTARVWDTARGTAIATLAHGGFLPQIDLAVDGTVASASWLGSARLWRLDRGALATTLVGDRASTSFPTAPAIAPDGRHAVRVGAAAVEVWNLDDGARRTIAAPGVELVNVAVDRSGTLAIGARDGTVVLHELVSGARRRALQTELRELTGLAVATGPDALLAIGCSATPCKTASVVSIEAARGVAAAARELGPIDTDTSVVPSPDGRWLATGMDATVTIWSRDGARVRELPQRATHSALAWSPAADRLYVALVDGAVAVWSTRDWRAEARIAAHQTWIPSLVASPDGSLLFTSGFDGSIRAWDTRTLRELSALSGRFDAKLAISPDARKLVAGDLGSLVVWRVDRSTVTPEGLATVMRCRVPFELREGTMVPRPTVQSQGCTEGAPHSGKGSALPK